MTAAQLPACVCGSDHPGVHGPGCPRGIAATSVAYVRIKYRADLEVETLAAQHLPGGDSLVVLQVRVPAAEIEAVIVEREAAFPSKEIPQ